MTVLGAVDPAELGVTLPHEHLLLDLTCLWHRPANAWQEGVVDLAPTLADRALLYTDPYISRPNLVLDDPEAAIEELKIFAEAGGKTVVDLTVEGIRPRPHDLPDIARSSGLNIIAGCGYYVKRAHPDSVSWTSVDELAERLIAVIKNGFDESGIRPGVIGEIGTGSPIHSDEAKVLRAAAKAQLATGLAINVHVAIFAREALAVLDVLEAAGADLSRVVISHLDEMLDLEYHRAVLSRSAYVEFDTFGSEFYFDSSNAREPSDGDRLDALLRLLDEGWSERLLLSQDVCTKLHLRRYGGFGYAHILRTIVPRLQARGVDAQTLNTMLVDNPARILSRDAG